MIGQTQQAPAIEAHAACERMSFDDILVDLTTEVSSKYIFFVKTYGVFTTQCYLRPAHQARPPRHYWRTADGTKLYHVV